MHRGKVSTYARELGKVLLAHGTGRHLVVVILNWWWNAEVVQVCKQDVWCVDDKEQLNNTKHKLGSRFCFVYRFFSIQKHGFSAYKTFYIWLNFSTGECIQDNNICFSREFWPNTQFIPYLKSSVFSPPKRSMEAVAVWIEEMTAPDSGVERTKKRTKSQ